MLIRYIIYMRVATYLRRAIRDLAKLPDKDVKLITGKIDQYASAPEELTNNVTEMKGTQGKRLRIGNYRVLFDENDTVLTIFRVRKRADAYRK